MAASEGMYYGDLPVGLSFDAAHDAEDPNLKECSVRGCRRLISSAEQNRMCEECRIRHRGYATTKRLRRKLEKAALQALGPGGVLMPPVIPVWEDAPVETWDPTIDPMLYDASVTATTTPTPAPGPIASSSSELANALTLPAQYLQPPTAPDCISPAVLQGSEEAPAEASDSNSDSDAPRFCSVKGCKAVIPGSYDYKMCPSCRTRYRGYGITKRAKWKNEREVFEREMAELRAAEDERRDATGLPPLADDPAELRAWEMSIIDEQITLPPPVLAALTAAGVNADGTVSRPLPDAQSLVATVLSLYQNEPDQRSEVDTPHSTVPYPSILGAIPPLPARMCTVSHCHQILPGYYRYKRCEQHRLQNRHHSKLKRVREKEEKAVGPKEDAVVLQIEPTSSKRKVKGKERATTPIELEVEPVLPPTKKKGKKVTHCVSEGCNNLLDETKRWHNCGDCRTAERREKSRLKAAGKVADSSGTVAMTVDAPPASVVILPTLAPSDLPQHAQSPAPPPRQSESAPVADQLQLVNITPESFDVPVPALEPTFRWSNETSVVAVAHASPAPTVDLSRPPSTSQPLMIRQYKPKGDDTVALKAVSNQPYVTVEQLPFQPRNDKEASALPPPPAVSTRASASQKAYPNAGVFRHYVHVPEEVVVEPPATTASTAPSIPSTDTTSVSIPTYPDSGVPATQPVNESEVHVQPPSAGPPSPGAINSAAPSVSAPVKTTKKTKAKGKSTPKANAAISIAPAPVPIAPKTTAAPGNHNPQLFPYQGHYPVHPYFYLPPQYTVNAANPYAIPGYPPIPPAPPPTESTSTTVNPSAAGASNSSQQDSGTIASAGSTTVATTSISAPPHAAPLPVPYPIPWPQPHMPYPYPPGMVGPPMSTSTVPNPPPGYFYPPYPYSASAPPLPGFGSGAGPVTAQVPAHAIASGQVVVVGGGGMSSSTPVSAPTSLPHGTSVSAPPKVKRTKAPKEVPAEKRFSYYHPGFGMSDSPETPTGPESLVRKRRKIDPAWAEKMRKKAEEEKVQREQQNQQQVEGVGPAASSSVVQHLVAPPPAGPVSLSAPPAFGFAGQPVFAQAPHVAVAQGVPAPMDYHRYRPESGVGMLAANGHPQPVEEDPPSSASAQLKPCSNKTCRRRVASSSSSATALCDKCKAKFKKHADKNKRKHKLVPIKPVGATSVNVDMGDGGRS
ncbi:hypothetical protein D9611_006716 [Ephemerocybe angulata]|uniref:Uncharacterized protein n=1 Tax=Ephemerocybe angulata TaxID=980116 RepID=A0A8H5C877_9AGAR|nr:hypothetical protein D9611_006716 [Tulosesus angulatus]